MYNYATGPAGLNLNFQNRGTPINGYVNPMDSQNQFGMMPPASPLAPTAQNSFLPAIGAFGMDTGTAITGYEAPQLPGVNPTAPGADEMSWFGKTFKNADGGLNMQNIFGAVSAIGSLWGANKQMGLAKDALNFEKETFRTNTANQTKTYNTALEGRARARFAQEGGTQEEADKYVKRNRL